MNQPIPGSTLPIKVLLVASLLLSQTFTAVFALPVPNHSEHYQPQSQSQPDGDDSTMVGMNPVVKTALRINQCAHDPLHCATNVAYDGVNHLSSALTGGIESSTEKIDHLGQRWKETVGPIHNVKQALLHGQTPFEGSNEDLQPFNKRDPKEGILHGDSLLTTSMTANGHEYDVRKTLPDSSSHDLLRGGYDYDRVHQRRSRQNDDVVETMKRDASAHPERGSNAGVLKKRGWNWTKKTKPTTEPESIKKTDGVKTKKKMSKTKKAGIVGGVAALALGGKYLYDKSHKKTDTVVEGDRLVKRDPPLNRKTGKMVPYNPNVLGAKGLSKGLVSKGKWAAGGGLLALGATGIYTSVKNWGKQKQPAKEASKPEKLM